MKSSYCPSRSGGFTYASPTGDGPGPRKPDRQFGMKSNPGRSEASRTFRLWLMKCRAFSTIVVPETKDAGGRYRQIRLIKRQPGLLVQTRARIPTPNQIVRDSCPPTIAASDATPTVQKRLLRNRPITDAVTCVSRGSRTRPAPATHNPHMKHTSVWLLHPSQARTLFANHIRLLEAFGRHSILGGFLP
jgi:hypothetical protein